MNLIDDIELDVLESTGDIELAERAGITVRYTLDEITDMIAELLGLGPSFSAQIYAALG